MWMRVGLHHTAFTYRDLGDLLYTYRRLKKRAIDARGGRVRFHLTLAPREHSGFEWLPWREAADRCFSPSNAEAILTLPRFAP